MLEREVGGMGKTVEMAGSSLMVPLGVAFWRMKVGFEREVGVGLGTWYALRHLRGEPGMSQGELGRRFDLDPSRITRLAQRLEREGLVRRERDAEDSRVMRMYLTHAGEATLSELAGAYEDFDRIVAESLEPGEMARLKESLAKVAKAVGTARNRKNDEKEEGAS